MSVWGRVRGADSTTVQRTFVHHVYATLARTPYNLDGNGAYQATAHTCVAAVRETEQSGRL
jgi:hypothetical protein